MGHEELDQRDREKRAHHERRPCHFMPFFFFSVWLEGLLLGGIDVLVWR